MRVGVGPVGKIRILPQMTNDEHKMHFKVDRQILEGESQTFSSIEETREDPLALSILGIPGVQVVRIEGDTVTTTLSEGYTFEEIIPKVQQAIEEHYGEDQARY